MLQTLHDKFSGVIAKIVLGIIVIVFGGFFGIQSYMNPQNETYVAKVDGKEVTQDQFRDAWNNYRAQIQQMQGGQFDPVIFDTPQRKSQMLDQLVDQQLLANASEKLQIMVPKSQVDEVIRNEPAFQVDGKFDADRAKMLLTANGRSPAAYRADIEKSIGQRILPAVLAQTVVVTDAEVNTYLRLRDQTRDFSYIKLDKPAADGINIADADIDAYYKAHSAEFMTAEKVSLQYVELDAAKMAVDITPDEAALKQRYEEQKARFTEEEQRLASHILVKVEKNANPEAQKAALEKAKAIAAEAKSGKDFAALAKEKSDDLGSKSTGGDLGWLAKGVTDPAFENALFSMNKGDISEPVLSPEGYHVIDLRDVRAGNIKPYAEVKAELAKQYLETERERRYSDISGKLTDAIYKDPSLEAAAKALGLPLQKTALFSRSGGIGIAANPKVLKAAFSSTVLSEGGTSDPIELEPNHIVLVHLDQHEASVPKSLDAVRDDIRKSLVDAELAKRAKEQADTLFARLQKGESLDQVAAVVKAKVEHEKDVGRNATNLDGRLVAEMFKAARPAEGKSVNVEVALADSAYALAALTGVKDADPAKLDAKTREAARGQISQGYSNEAVRGFIEVLRKSADIKRAEDRLQ